MNTDGTGFYICKECHKTEPVCNHTTTDHKEGEQLEDRRNVAEIYGCNFGDGTDHRVQPFLFMMMMMGLHPPTTSLVAQMSGSDETKAQCFDIRASSHCTLYVRSTHGSELHSLCKLSSVLAALSLAPIHGH